MPSPSYSRTSRRSARAFARDAARALQDYRDKDAAGELSVDDVRRAVELFTNALRALPDEDPDEPAYRYNLAIALQSQYDAQGARIDDATDLLSAIDQLEAALDGDGARNLRPTLQYGLGSALRRLYLVDRDGTHLTRAIGLLGDALASGNEALDVPDCMYEYGQSLLAAAEDHDEPRLLDEAVRSLEALVLGVDPETPDMAAYLDAAGSARMTRFDHYGKRADLRLARKLARAAVDCQRSRRKVTAAALANLAMALRPQALWGGEDEGSSLDRSIALTREAIAITEREVAGAAGALAADRLAGLRSNLVAILLERMDRTNDLDELDSIVTLAATAVEDTKPGTPQYGVRAHQASIAYRNRHLRYGSSADLRETLRLARAAIDAPVSPRDRLIVLDGLGNTLQTLYDVTGRVEDLKRAVRAYELAVDHTPLESSDRPARLQNLGAARSALAYDTNDPAAMDAAFANLSEASATARPDSVERTRALINLGNVAADRFARAHMQVDRDVAEAAYHEVRAALHGRPVGAESVLQAALNATDLAEDAGDWQGMIDWAETAFDAIDDLLVLQRQRGSKESWLQMTSGLSERAARAAILLSDDPTAVTFLERGRAVLLRESVEQTRLDLQALSQAGGTELAKEVEAARVRAARRDGETVNPSGPTLRELRDRIRQVPGFEAFLRPTDVADIQTCANTAPLIYLAPGRNDGIAIIVTTGGVTHRLLPLLTEEAVRDRVATLFTTHDRYSRASGHLSQQSPEVKDWQNALDRAASWLWDAVAPVVRQAGRGGRVVIVAGGLLGILPVQAAWCPDQSAPTGRHYLLDEVEVSFTPSAAALLTAMTRVATSQSERLLSICDPLPTSLPFLPNARIEADVAGWGRASETTRLQGVGADVDRAEEVLPTVRFLHASCHGFADAARPLDSGLVLADDRRLDLRRILELDMSLRLAVLSACESGLPGTSLPDESVSLPSGLLQAGASGVVASTWAVPDASTLALMTEFYRRWRFGKGEPPSRALSQAQSWMRDTTNGAKLEAWASQVDVGALSDDAYEALADVYQMADPDALGDKEIATWGLFSHVGL